MNYVFKNGSSLVMSEHPALSTYRGRGGTSPLRAGKQCSQLGPQAEPHKHITWFMLHLKTLKSALRPPDRESSGRTHTGSVAAAPARTQPWPSLSSKGWESAAQERPGEGEGDACHLALSCFVSASPFFLPCYYPWLQDIVFVTKTLFPTLHNLEKGHLNGT